MKLHGPIKGIFFDIGWTLVQPRSGDWMFSSFARQYFPQDKLDNDRARAAMKEGSAYLDSHHLLSTIEEEEALFYRYYAGISAALPELGLTDEDVRKVAKEQATYIGPYQVYPDAIPTLQALKGKYKLGIISDTWPSIVPRMEAYGLREFFGCVTYSYTLGVYKPHPKMYADALGKMGLPPEQTVFVDDFTGNLEGARAAGIQPVLIQAKPGAQDTDSMVKIKKISDLLVTLP